MKIGFIGLGIMGRPMALNLNAAQHSLVVHDRASLTDEIRAAAKVVAGRQVAGGGVRGGHRDGAGHPRRGDRAVRPERRGRGAEAGHAGDRHVLDQPDRDQGFARKINEMGCDYLDAPVSGGEVGAKQATLTIMVGGPDAAFARAKPLFEKLGKNITHVGPNNGAGQTCKVANQIIVALNIQAVSRGAGVRLQGRAPIRPRCGRR